MTAFENQVGGDHYAKLRIQPVEYIYRNGLGFCEGSVIKYVTRWGSKGGIDDLRKARHFIDLLIEMETGEQERSYRKTAECDHDWRRINSNVERCAKCEAVRINSEYCDSERYDINGDTWTAQDFGPDDAKPEPERWNITGCQHTHWHRYVSLGRQTCADCGLETRIDDPAKQIKHKRKSGC